MSRNAARHGSIGGAAADRTMRRGSVRVTGATDFVSTGGVAGCATSGAFAMGTVTCVFGIIVLRSHLRGAHE